MMTTVNQYKSYIQKHNACKEYGTIGTKSNNGSVCLQEKRCDRREWDFSYINIVTDTIKREKWEV